MHARLTKTASCAGDDNGMAFERELRHGKDRCVECGVVKREDGDGARQDEGGVIPSTPACDSIALPDKF